MNVIDVKMECGSVDDQLLNSHAHGSFCQRPIVPIVFCFVFFGGPYCKTCFFQSMTVE